MAFNAAIPKVTKVSQTNPTNFVSLPQIIRSNYIEKKALFNLSSGKDSALLYKTLQIRN
jgi:hypothetical protein